MGTPGSPQLPGIPSGTPPPSAPGSRDLHNPTAFGTVQHRPPPPRPAPLVRPAPHAAAPPPQQGAPRAVPTRAGATPRRHFRLAAGAGAERSGAERGGGSVTTACEREGP